MPEFDYTRLRRHPDVEAANLQAWDATDELLVAQALAAGVAGTSITVIGDNYGAITLALTAAGLTGIRVHQDLITGRRALARNAQKLEIAGYTDHELDADLLADTQLVLMQLPKSLAELDETAQAIARWAAPDVTVLAGGRVKHMTLAQNDVLARYFAGIQPQRAARKSRLIKAHSLTPAPDAPTYPTQEQHGDLTLCAHGGAFAGTRLDIGTRALLDVLDAIPGVSHAVDLGCGTGALAAAYAMRHPDARVVATDRSAAAVRSARATMRANNLADQVTVTLDDAGSELTSDQAELVLLNPPFHLGNSVHEGAGQRLIAAAARLLREGGEVWTVYNSHLEHRRVLEALVGPTEQVHRTSKFTVTRSTKRISER